MRTTVWMMAVAAAATLGLACEVTDDIEDVDALEIDEDLEDFEEIQELVAEPGTADPNAAAQPGWQFCVTGKECGKKQFCERPGLSCLHWGVCVPRPQGCFDLWDPVCGCDGQTYSNTCYANAAGVDISSEDACGGIGIDPAGVD